MSTSIRARAFLALLRHAHLFTLKPGRPPFDPSPGGLARFRQRVENPGPLFGKVPKGITITPRVIAGRTAEWVHSTGDDGPGPKTMLYFHGGMYVCGSPKGHRTHVAKFVRGSGCPALVIDYRLAPEFPFPAGLNDALAAYAYLLESRPFMYRHWASFLAECPVLKIRLCWSKMRSRQGAASISMAFASARVSV